MKKLLALILSLCLALSVFAVPAMAATSTKLTASELSIIQAYQKTLETKNLQYINKYKFSGVTYKMLSIPGGSVAKIIAPQYSKAYDSKQKMYNLCLKGILVITNGKTLSASNITCGVYLKTQNKKTYAYNAITTSTKALQVNSLNSSQKSEVKKYLSSLYGEKTANNLVNPTTQVGTLGSPVSLNQKYTWSETKEFLDDKISGTYSLTVKSFAKLTQDQMDEIGINDNDAKCEYAIVDILWEVQNAQITKVKGDGEAYLSVGWDPDIWGTKTSAGDSVIGSIDYGFEGTLGDAVDEATDLRKITPGMIESFTAEGKVIIKLYKNKTNYLVVQNEQLLDIDYNSSFIYFKLQ
jgi:hypothetical protein